MEIYVMLLLSEVLQSYILAGKGDIYILLSELWHSQPTVPIIVSKLNWGTSDKQALSACNKLFDHLTSYNFSYLICHSVTLFRIEEVDIKFSF